MNKNKSELRKIPFIGPNIEQDLLNIGISRIADLKGKDPEELYRMDCEFKGWQEGGFMPAVCFPHGSVLCRHRKPGPRKAEMVVLEG